MSIRLLIPSSNSSCPGGCFISSCHACYYAVNKLPFPLKAMSCPKCSDNKNGIDGACIKEWGQCIDKALNMTSVSIVIKLMHVFFSVKQIVILTAIVKHYNNLLYIGIFVAYNL